MKEVSPFLARSKPGADGANELLRETEIREIGRRLGYDMALRGLRVQPEDWPPWVIEGCAEAHERRRHTPADRFVRKWLQLRGNAFRRGRAVDDGVTPEFLRLIDVAACPVTRRTLTHGEQLPSDWSIDRLNNDGAYAPSNLAVMSTLANRAKGSLTHADVCRFAQEVPAGSELSPAEWLRLAALMLGPCHAKNPQVAPFVPMVVPAPKYVPMLIIQQVQHVLAERSGNNATRNALQKDLRQACRDDRARTRLSLLVDRVQRGVKGLENPCDVWLQTRAVDLLQDWRSSLDGPAWGHVGEISRRWAGGRAVGLARVGRWKLDQMGYL